MARLLAPRGRTTLLALTRGAVTVKSLSGASLAPACARLFDLAFAELDMLLGDGIVFLFHQLVGHGARVFSSHVIESRIRAGDQLHFDGGRLGHGRKPLLSLRARN